MLDFMLRYIPVILLCFVANLNGQDDIGKLPDCIKNHNSGYVLVSTLDGKFSALDSSGLLSWQVDTGPGPLLVSNIHNLELSNSGQWVRIIPSLSGNFYKFDGINVDRIPLTADKLLKSSFRYTDDLVIAGGLDVRTYGISLSSGTPLYECSTLRCKNITENEDYDGDVLLIERNTQVVRAVEPRSGSERWNFSVGLHNVKIPQVSCINIDIKINFNITAVLPEGLLIATTKDKPIEHLWEYKFNSPIVNIWKWNGKEMIQIDLFGATDAELSVTPTIYVGMHNKQLYIHELQKMQNSLEVMHRTSVTPADSNSLTRIPWKPVSLNDKAYVPVEADSTALSVLYASEYVNGNGYYLYTESDKEKTVCNSNITVEKTEEEDSIIEDYVINSIWYWWKEVLVISITTAIVFNIMFRSFIRHHQRPNQEIVFVERHVEVPVPLEQPSNSRTNSESSESSFTSRYLNDFETVSCLGKGGFGVVFQVKQKIDECNYAIKRITLPKEKTSRDRVMREVKVLAKLDHHNIVRYFNSWVECPPYGWHINHDSKWIHDTTSQITSANTFESSYVKRSNISVSACKEAIKYDASNSDSYIVFDKTGKSDSAVTMSTQDTTSEHLRKKINWKRPDRRHHSLDTTSTGVVGLSQPPSPVFLYIQMQLCRRESLKDWLNENSSRDFHQILNIFSQILAAVEYVHLQGLIHRDLKPSNIFFSLEGQIKVGDFGLVTDMQESLENEFSITHSPRGHTKAVGTKLYMSPEQLVNSRYNYKVDIYSLGLIFFELLRSFSTEMERICILTDLRDKKYPSDFSKTYPRERNLLDLMLSENPKERPTTFGIKARPPFKTDHSEDCPGYHFELPLLKKSNEVAT